MMTKRENWVAGVAAVMVAACLAGCGKEETVILPPPKSAGAPAGEQSVDQLLGGPAAPVRSVAPVAPTGAGAGVPGGAKVKVDPVLKAAIERYFENSGRAPEAWMDLVKKQLIPAVPLDASGKPLDFRQFLLDMR